MARIPERKFDPAQPVFARKYFIANGRKYVPGMAFPWRKDAIAQRRVAQMFDAGKLTHNDNMMVKVTPEPVGFTVEDKYSPEVINEEYNPEAIPNEAWEYWSDDLDNIEDMKELRAIADSIGAPYKVSKVDQRQAIRDHRKEMNNG